MEPLITPAISALISSDNGRSQGQFSLGARDQVDTPVQAHSIQAASQFSEGRGYSFDTGVHTLSTCGGQGEKTAVAHLSLVTITRVWASVLRSHKGANREASRSSFAISDLRV